MISIQNANGKFFKKPIPDKRYPHIKPKKYILLHTTLTYFVVY